MGGGDQKVVAKDGDPSGLSVDAGAAGEGEVFGVDGGYAVACALGDVEGGFVWGQGDGGGGAGERFLIFGQGAT